MKMVNFCIAALIAAAALALGAPPILFHDHGHGLSFSSDGKTLLAPSHDGLAFFEDGAWWEASGPIHGFSGFSVAERAIYSSGHSRPGVAAAGSAGLLRSADSGKTWQPLALAGEADFRLLAAGYRSGAIYVMSARPNSAMRAPGLYMTHDEGKTWSRAEAQGLQGEIHGLAAHPQQTGTVAVATDRGLYLSRDAGVNFLRLEGKQPVTAVAFDFDGKRLRYARAISNDVIEMTLDGRQRSALRLPRLRLDYVTCLAQSPANERVLAFATRRRDVYLSVDGARTWLRIAEEGDARDSTGAERPR